MNIFALDIDPFVAARKTVWKKHIVKMPTESAQMLSLALREIYKAYDDKQMPSLYKYSKSYTAHPCTKWVLKSSANFEWLAKYAFELCDMFDEVYGHVHSAKAVIYTAFFDYYVEGMFNYHELTPFYCAMPVVYYPKGVYQSHLTMEQSIEAYNRYYELEKLKNRSSNDLYYSE